MHRETLRRSSDRRGRIPVAFVAALLSVACSGGLRPGFELGELDGGPPGAWMDAGRDGGVVDAGAIDAFTPPTREGWRWVEGLPRGCHAWIADDPAAVAPLEWTACVEASEGCRALAPRHTPRYAQFLRVEGAQWDPARGEATFVWWWEHESAERDYVVSDTAGRTYSAWKFVNHAVTGRCYPTAFATGDGRVAIAISTESSDGDDLIFAGRIDDGGPLELIARLTSEDLGSNSVQALEVTEATIGASTGGGHQAWRFGWDGTRTRLTPPPDTSLLLRDAHEGALLLNEAGARGRVIVADDAGQRVLVDPGEAEKAAFPRGDGQHLVWQLANRRVGVWDYDRVELWASPYTTNAAALEPRRVALLPVTVLQSSAALTNGHVTLPGPGAETLTIYSLDDGREGQLRAPEGMMFKRSLVTDDELVVFLGGLSQRQVLRIELHQLARLMID